MKHSKEDVKNAILFFAKLYTDQEGYSYLLIESGNLTRTIERIVYKMFMEKFCYHICTTEEYEQYMIILKFSIELNENGFVEYEKTI
jgi:hypothetical protein